MVPVGEALKLGVQQSRQGELGTTADSWCSGLGPIHSILKVPLATPAPRDDLEFSLGPPTAIISSTSGVENGRSSALPKVSFPSAC